MGLPADEVEKVKLSGLLHDVGKIGVDDRIIRKPTALTEEEFELMKTHPVKGAAIMAAIPQLADVIPGMKYHHEKWQGGGYPEGLKGEEIPLQARIVTVADTFDAMTTTRPYQKAMEIQFVVERDPPVRARPLRSPDRRRLRPGLGEGQARADRGAAAAPGGAARGPVRSAGSAGSRGG